MYFVVNALALSQFNFLLSQQLLYEAFSLEEKLGGRDAHTDERKNRQENVAFKRE